MIERIRSFCNKYKDQGLDICIKFSNMEIILRAYWHNEKGELLTYYRIYCYCNDANLEEMIDRFADETLQYKRSGLI